MHDLLIKNGTVVDGTGAAPVRADVAVNGGIITEVGDLGGDSAHEVVDAADMLVAPGFIDISNRSDTRWRLFTAPQMESMLYQGVTTIIGGNSGASLAPIYNDDMINATRKWADVQGVNVGWHTMREFLDTVEAKNLAVNFGTFVGYGTLRRGITGDEMRAVTEEEKKSLHHHVRMAFKEGALGVSTGLIYSHEKDISTEELVALAAVTAKERRLFVAHLRNETDDAVNAVREVLTVHRQTKVRTHISHLKVMGKNNWARMPEMLALIEKTPIHFDVYPYTASEMVLYVFLPTWASTGGRRMMMGRLRNPALRKQAAEAVDAGVDLSDAVVAQTQRSHYFCGKTFGEIARTQKKTVGESVIDVLLASDGRVTIFLDAISEENVVRGIMSAHAIISSNGAGCTIEQCNSENIEHPRSFGAFARAWALYVRGQKILEPQEMIHKCTGKVAEALQLKDRGVITPGKKADVIVFKPEILRDVMRFARVPDYAEGIHTVVVNGQIAVKYGKYTGVRAGGIVRN